MNKRYKITYPGSEITVFVSEMGDLMAEEGLTGNISYTFEESSFGYQPGAKKPKVYRTESVSVIFHLDDEQLKEIKKDHPDLQFEELNA